MSVISRIKSKRFSATQPLPSVQSEASVSDLKKIYSEFARKMSFANRSRSQTFDLAEIQGANDDSVRENGKLTKNHALLFACIRGDIEAVESLLLSGDIDVDYVNHNSTALHKASGYGHTEIIKLLLHYGADIDARNADGMTALSIAAAQSHLDAVNMLLHYNASTQVVDNQGQSLLHHASRSANVAILQVLLQQPYSLDIFHQSTRGFTPLHAAAGNDNVECVNELLALGGSQLINIISNEDTTESMSTRGVTAFHLAAEFGFYDCFLACTNIEGVDLWKKTAVGSTSLHLACKHGHANIVEHILSKLPDKFDAADPKFYDSKHNTPLHCAALSRNPRCVTLLGIKLLSSKSGGVQDWDCPNSSKDYPAHLACTNDNADALRELLAHKVSIGTRNTQHETPLYIAVVGGFRNCVGLLLQAGASFTDMNANKSLKFEEIGNDIRIDAGTLNELVDHVITGNADEEFRKSFFIIYKCFTNAVELLNEIKQKLIANWEQNDFVNRVVKVCEFWITNHSRDFRSDAQLLENMTQILKDVRERAGMEMVGKQMLALLSKKTHGPVTKRAREISKILSTQGFYVEDTGHVLAVTKSLKIAQQLCLIEYDIFYSIKKEELFHAAWNHKEKEHISPNVIVFIGRFEQVSKWVRGILLKAEKISYRAKLLQKCIKIALKCYELRNYTTVMQIMAALESAPISRLNHTWAKISDNMKEKYNVVCQQLLPAANYKNYRALIAKAEPPCVPYIGTYLTDLTFIDEGNPDYIVDGTAQLINYKKFQMISELIQRIQRFQRIGYTFTLDNELKKYLLQSYVTMDDNTAYKLSLKIDPKVL